MRWVPLEDLALEGGRVLRLLVRLRPGGQGDAGSLRPLADDVGREPVGTAYVTEPSSKALHMVDLESGEVVSSGELPVVPNEIDGTLG